MPAEAQHAILLVEDDVDEGEALALLLGARGYAVTVATDGAEALAVLAAGLQPCLIVLDLALPHMGGLEFMTRQRRDVAAGFGGIPVILYSNGYDLTRVARTAGAAAGVQKPDIDRLFHFVALLC